MKAAPIVEFRPSRRSNGAIARRHRSPFREVADEQPASPALERVVESKAFPAGLAHLNAEADHVVVHEDCDLRPPVAEDFTNRSVNLVRIALQSSLGATHSQGWSLADSKMLLVRFCRGGGTPGKIKQPCPAEAPI